MSTYSFRFASSAALSARAYSSVPEAFRNFAQSFASPESAVSNRKLYGVVLLRGSCVHLHSVPQTTSVPDDDLLVNGQAVKDLHEVTIIHSSGRRRSG